MPPCCCTCPRPPSVCRQEKHGQLALPPISATSDGLVSEQLCAAAAATADALRARALFVFTRTGRMASLLSRCRPDAPILAFTDRQEVRQALNLRWGVSPFRMDFAEHPEDRIHHAFSVGWLGVGWHLLWVLK